ncbi:MAG: DUF2358 domain-containing protein [Phormidium sp. GEM2.Bin31]|nr:DUF2358 domain-containing protein [Phormidium sp. BM_Day4_Bin.17]TVR11718.1 MAG: DUF2358 domain-containing protein [Phormidium sp. GEM2.Bin31]UCJ11358.1 MAG: DUF2358 domain-containing protein [Phormidium sp. PBR-2020]
MTLLDILRQDYQSFPEAQTYEIYAEDVYFKDPLNEFRGCDRYRQNINFIATWFKAVHLELHDIRQEGDRILTDWTLEWNTPLPWFPRISIPGWSELTVNAEGKISRHLDYWHCSPGQVLRQHFPGASPPKHPNL